MADESEETPPEDEPVMATADPIPVEEMSRKEKKVAEGAVLAIEGPPEGTVLSIVETMPAAPPMTNLTDTYTQEKTDDDGAGAAVPVVTAAFFTPAQIEVLNAQPMPPDRPATIEGVVVAAVPPDEATPAEEAIGAPLLTTAAGVPVVAGTVASTAETQPDGWQGVKSCDERLLGSAPECLLFLQTHNTRPHLAVNVHGWHRERRTRRTDHGVEHYEITVDDFEYPIDLTNFVYPYGFIQSDEIVSNEDKDGNEQIDDVPGLVNGFVSVARAPPPSPPPPPPTPFPVVLLRASRGDARAPSLASPLLLPARGPQPALVARDGEEDPRL